MVRGDPFFHQSIGKGKGQGGTLLRRRVEQAWRLRWGAMLSCAAARAFASSLMDRRTAVGSDGVTLLSHDVEGDFRHSGLGL